MPHLTWLGDEAARRASRRVPYRILEAVETVGDPAADNLLIQGDNLEALKALLPFYAGRVKCIYADPPFNTKQAFADYDDNLEHSQWLSMMYPLLELQRELLAPDGTLFIHIDDNELAYLVAAADEVFGRTNRVGLVTFKQGAPTGHKAINPGLVSTTNFVAVYARNRSSWKPNRVFTGRERDKRYGQFLLNPTDHYSNWRFCALTAAIKKITGKTSKQLKTELKDDYESFVDTFVLHHASQVIQFVRPDYDGVGKEVRERIDASLEQPDRILHLVREGFPDIYLLAGQRIIFYSGKLKEIDGQLVAGEPLTTLWDDLLSNNLHKEGGVELPRSKKPEALLKRVLDLSTTPGDLVLDAFLGSGTTMAVALKMKRVCIGVERGDHAVTKCLPRLRGVIDGDPSGISEAVGWKGGGGFRFMKLGAKAFFDDGALNADIRFKDLAAYLWFLETRTPHPTVEFKSPLLGVQDGIAYVLLYNGIIADRRPESGNVLTTAVWNHIRPLLPRGRRGTVIYGEASRFSDTRLRDLGLTFKQIPYDVGMR